VLIRLIPYDERIVDKEKYHGLVIFNTIEKVTVIRESKYNTVCRLHKSEHIVYRHHLNGMGAYRMFGVVEESKRLSLELGEKYILEIEVIKES
jgi:hypothetical protein